MSKFTITFNRKIQEVQKEKILDLLEINLRGSLYKDIERIGNDRLVIEGEFYSFMPSKNVPPLSVASRYAQVTKASGLQCQRFIGVLMPTQ